MTVFGLGDLAFLGAVGGAERDPFFANVSLLLHGDGANGSTTIIDSSPSPKTVTAFDNARISTAQSRFGEASLFLPTASASATHRIEVSPGSAFDFESLDFTIELFYYPIAQSAFSAIISRDGNDFPWTLYHGTAVNNGNPLIQFGSASAWSSQALSFGSIANNQWHHLAITRQSGVFRAFTNGTLAQTASSWSGSIGSVSGSLVIGRNGSQTLQAHIEELRITSVARYTTNFTPPTAPFPDA